MNYIELINRFWEKDAQLGGFTDKEVAFYFYLLKVFNSAKWKSPVGISNAFMMVRFGWGRHALNTVKNRLKQAELIDFEQRKGRGRMYQYVLINPSRSLKRSTVDAEQNKELNPLPELHTNGSKQRKAEIMQRASIAIQSCSKGYL